jgi:Zn-dependent peptidase ImmA (M78 family)
MEKVPWLDRSEINGKAKGLWRDFEDLASGVADVPVPVEAILEQHLRIRMEFDDLERLLGVPDVLGATWIEDNLMIFDERLLDGVEGRLVFTYAHEIGHWLLHKDFLQTCLRRDTCAKRKEPVIICRKHDAKLRGEWQADYFAACLLMPEEPVRSAYSDCFGPDPLVMHNRKSCFGPRSIVLDPALDTAKEIARRVIEAGGFSNVSKAAMRYRLEELGLLINRVFC